jgi:hypothetical protein
LRTTARPNAWTRPGPADAAAQARPALVARAPAAWPASRKPVGRPRPAAPTLRPRQCPFTPGWSPGGCPSRPANRLKRPRTPRSVRQGSSVVQIARFARGREAAAGNLGRRPGGRMCRRLPLYAARRCRVVTGGGKAKSGHCRGAGLGCPPSRPALTPRGLRAAARRSGPQVYPRRRSGDRPGRSRLWPALRFVPASMTKVDRLCRVRGNGGGGCPRGCSPSPGNGA